jgi:hypothetical protein
LTQDDVGDVPALRDFLDQIEHPVGSLTADGAYDGEPSTMEYCNDIPQRR